MFRVTREIHFCYGHRLLNYDGKCRHLHGHNGRAVITLQGSELDDRGMLVDFGEIKQKIQRLDRRKPRSQHAALPRRSPVAVATGARRTRLRDGGEPDGGEHRPAHLREDSLRPGCRSSRSCSGRPRTALPRLSAGSEPDAPSAPANPGRNHHGVERSCGLSEHGRGRHRPVSLGGNPRQACRDT